MASLIKYVNKNGNIRLESIKLPINDYVEETNKNNSHVLQT